MFNKLTPEELERLSILSEELGEAVQAIGKILRHGYDSCHPDTRVGNREALTREAADVVVAVELLLLNCDLDRELIVKFAEQKILKAQKFMHYEHAWPNLEGETES